MRSLWSAVLIINFIMISVSFATKLEIATKIEIVKIPGGTLQPFWLGVTNKQNNVKIVKELKIPILPFVSMTSQVTVAEYKQFLEVNPKWKKENISALFADASYLKEFNNEKAPVTWVSWFAARAFCESLNMRLPSINEWEYMAQASEKKKNAIKEPDFLKRILDWYGEPQMGQLKDTKSIYKNIYGVWDLHGLVWEWVEDFNSNFVTGESREDSSLNKDMFCGAGSMSSADKENYAAFMRFAFRSSLKGKSSVWNLGFRCVK